VLAALSEKLLFIELTSSAMEDNRIINGGLCVCEQNSRIVLSSRKSSFEYSLATGDSGKVYSLVSEECIETCDTAKMVSGVELGMEKRAGEGRGTVARSNEAHEDEEGRAEGVASDVTLSLLRNKGSRNIYPGDDVTCVTCGACMRVVCALTRC
jgi:hypothetical protein